MIVMGNSVSTRSMTGPTMIAPRFVLLEPGTTNFDCTNRISRACRSPSQAYASDGEQATCLRQPEVHFPETISPDRPVEQSDEEMGQVCLCSQPVEVFECLVEESGRDAWRALQALAGESQHDQIEGCIANESEVGIDDGREVGAVDQKVSWVKVPVDDVVSDEVVHIEGSSKGLNPLDQQSGAIVVIAKGGMLAVAVPAGSKRGDEVYRPTNGVVGFGQSESAIVQREQLLDELVVDPRGRCARHELLDDEANIVGVDHPFRRNGPARPNPEPLGEDDGLSPMRSPIRRHVPLHDDRPAVWREELVGARFAASERPERAELAASDLRED